MKRAKDYEDPPVEGEATSHFDSVLSQKLSDENWFSMWGDIGDLTCEQASKFLLSKLFEFQKKDTLNDPNFTKRMVTLVLCSPGGEEDDLRALLGIMEICKSQGMVIRIIGAGVIASAGFDLLIAGSQGWRFVFEATMLMTHSSAGHVEDEDMYALQRRFDQWTLRHYTNIHASTRKRFLKTGNWWFDPETAVGYGAADFVIKVGDKIPDAPQFPKRKSVEEQKAEAENAANGDGEDD